MPKLWIFSPTKHRFYEVCVIIKHLLRAKSKLVILLIRKCTGLIRALQCWGVSMECVSGVIQLRRSTLITLVNIVMNYKSVFSSAHKPSELQCQNTLRFLKNSHTHGNLSLWKALIFAAAKEITFCLKLLLNIGKCKSHYTMYWNVKLHNIKLILAYNMITMMMLRH